MFRDAANMLAVLGNQNEGGNLGAAARVRRFAHCCRRGGWRVGLRGSLALRQATPPRLRYHCKGPMERSARQSCGAVVSQHVFVRPDVTVQPIVPRVPAQTVQTLVKNNRAQKQLNWTRQEELQVQVQEDFGRQSTYKCS